MAGEQDYNRHFTGAVRFRNVSGSTIPGRSVIRLTEAVIQANGETYMEADVPEEGDLLFAVYAFTGARSVSNDSYGIATLGHLPAVVRYDDSGSTPVVGSQWGPVPDDFRLSKDGVGFIVGQVDEDLSRIRVFPASPFQLLVGRTTVDHDQCATEDVEQLVGEKGLEVPSGKMFPCFNRFGDLVSGQNVLFGYVYNGYEILVASCDDFNCPTGESSLPPSSGSGSGSGSA